MSTTMREMAAEYRAAAAMLAMRIREKQAAGAGKQELYPLREALTDIRRVQRTLDSYYTVPRDESITSAGWRGRGPSRDDH